MVIEKDLIIRRLWKYEDFSHDVKKARSDMSYDKKFKRTKLIKYKKLKQFRFSLYKSKFKEGPDYIGEINLNGIKKKIVAYKTSSHLRKKKPDIPVISIVINDKNNSFVSGHWDPINKTDNYFRASSKGALWNNKYKVSKTDKKPDYTGIFSINGIRHKVAAWKGESNYLNWNKKLPVLSGKITKEPTPQDYDEP